AMGNLVDLEAGAVAPDGGVAGPNTTGWKNLMKTPLHVNSGGDLIMDFSAQCGLLTDTTVKSMNGTLDVSEAEAGIRFRIAIYAYNSDGSVGAFVRYAKPSVETDPFAATAEVRDGVTYCDRYQKLAAKFSGLNCTADLTTGAITCASPEELELLIRTLDAH